MQARDWLLLTMLSILLGQAASFVAVALSSNALSAVVPGRAGFAAIFAGRAAADGRRPPCNARPGICYAGGMATASTIQTRPIPKTGEPMPVIGLGTWQTFDIGSDGTARATRATVLRTLLDAGATMIDSSPMYGRAESVVGDLLPGIAGHDKAFLATKVWTRGEASGIDQMNESFRRFGAGVIDLMQIHNLVDWRTQLRTLRAWKDAGRFRYIGITHYTASAFDELASVMRTEALDFVQLPYSIVLREAERELLPLAADRGIAVIVNRPFEGGGLLRRQRAPLPPGVREHGIESWSQLFLKYVLAEPAVTCVIPGTANPSHLADNLAAGRGPLPDAGLRARLIRAAGA